VAKVRFARRIAAAAGSVLVPIAAQAQLAPAGPATLMPEVAVTATRVEENVKDVPATISVIDAQQIDRELVQSVQNLFRYEPGVSVNSDPNRFGASSINIRGLEGNRVLIEVDGVRAPSLFTFGVGPFNTSTRNMVDLDSMKRVEVLRGPASTLYGSDALGGVVSYITKDPLDYLDLARSPFYGGIKSLYASANNGWTNTATGAAGTKDVQGLVVYSYYTGSETANFGGNDATGAARTAPNPLDVRESGVLAKLAFTPDANNTLKLTFEGYRNRSDVDIQSLNASTPKTSSLYGQDENTRYRGTAAYDWRNPAGGWFAGFSASVYQQTSRTDSDSQETRTATSAGCSGTANGTSTCYIPREFNFQQTVSGATAQLESLVPNGAASQRILWGFEVYETATSALRDATIRNLTTGTTTRTLAGDTFPVRDFPNTKSTTFGAYVQDQVSLFGDRLVVTPALRWDHYDLTIRPDATYDANVPPGVAPSDFSDSAWSPKLAAQYALNDTYNVYANYAFGFRAPPFDDVNAAFRNPIQSYVLIPNPDLKSETSQGIEVGLKGEGRQGRIAVAAFYNRYKDFIDSRVALDCPADPLCVPGFFFTFQSVNRARVRIYGAEAKGEWLLHPGVTLAGSIAYANGEDTDTGEPLNSVAPLTGVIGVRYDGVTPSYGTFGGALNVTMVERKRDIAPVGGVTPFDSPGFATVDLTGYWNYSRNLRIAAGIFNLLDKKYWLWSDVNTAALGQSAASLDRYTQPGINASVSVQLAF
jgi:hemoglobin/transferrin/lactoferrin receptor protein